ncbi:MAG: TonB-dependent receptor, partial [bacterium]
MRKHVWILLAAVLVATTAVAQTTDEDGYAEDLTDLSIEELLNIPVTSAAKKTERLAHTSSAIYVITAEDIRRLGITTLSEALRLVPGLQVAQINNSQFAISSRGFNSRFSTKLLVLVDGHHVYTPLFSGVFWETMDICLEDVEHIEVIRGPGATLWGANAVNGVINVITKSAASTQGGLATVGYGGENQGFGVLRQGGRLGEDAWYRAFVKYSDSDDSLLENGGIANDACQTYHGGFRSDFDLSPRDELTVLGAFSERVLFQANQVFIDLEPPYTSTQTGEHNNQTAHVLSCWRHEKSPDSELELQLYFDYQDVDFVVVNGDEKNLNLDFHHRFALGQRHDIVWGCGYRHYIYRTFGNFAFNFDPQHGETNLYSTFVQDQIQLIAERLQLTLGSKIEHNDFTGIEVQPATRLLWTPHTNHTVWLAMARAVRTPSIAERNLHAIMQMIPPDSLYPGSPLALIESRGRSTYDSEDLLACELGYRIEPSDNLFLDLAIHFGVYDNLRATEPLPTETVLTDPLHLVMPITLNNWGRGEIYGGELVLDYQASQVWHLRGS